MPDLQPVLSVLGKVLPFPGMEEGFMQRAAAALILLAPAAATMGIQVVTFRMAFFSDAIGHSVFLGIALGLWLAVDPRLSMLLLGVVVALGVTAYLRRSVLSTDAVIGVVFSAVMAAGLALMSRYRSMAGEIQRYVYGDVLTVTNEDLWLLLGMLGAVAFYQVLHYNRSMAVGVSAAVAQVHGVRVAALQYMFAVLVALYAGALGVPLIYVSGDEAACFEARALFPHVTTTPTKRGLRWDTCELYDPSAVRSNVRRDIAEAVRNIPRCRPWQLVPPIRIRVEWSWTGAADGLAAVPNVRRVAPRTVEWDLTDARDVFTWPSDRWTPAPPV